MRGRSAAVALWLPWLGSPGNLSQPPSAWGIRLPIETIVKSARLVSARAYAIARSAESVGGCWLSVPIGADVKTKLPAMQTDRFDHGLLRPLVFKSFWPPLRSQGSDAAGAGAGALSRPFYKENAPFWSTFNYPLLILRQSCSGMLQHPPRIWMKSRRPM